MGCISSNFSYDCNESIYGASLEDRSKPFKRNFSKRFGSTDSSSLDTEESSGGSKFWSSTSNWSRCSTPPTTTTTAKKTKVKRSVCGKLSSHQMPKALAKLTLGDKSKNGTESPQQQRLHRDSNGYYSASTDNFESSDSDSFDTPSLFLCTQDIDTTSKKSTNTTNHSITTESDVNAPVSNIKMEIVMLRENRQLMPKTSSPYCARRDAFACSGNASYTGTYRRWIQCLEETPAYMFKDITAIPEAISGQLSPSNHPAYTDVWNSECVSPSKRYRRRYNEHAATNVPLGFVVLGNPLPSTEL